MITNPSNRQTVRSVAVAALIGVVLALPALAVCIEVAGGGHGSAWAFYAFFAPEWVVWMLPPEKQGNTFIGLWLAILGMLGLYGIYGGMIAYARSRRVGTWAFVTILSFHYALLVWLALGFKSADQLSGLGTTLANLSILYSVGLVELFVALHLLALQYAQSTVPYRPRMTWPVAMILLGGLITGMALYAWGVSLA